MAYATYKGENNLTDLARRLYKIEGARAEERAKEAGEAILRSNPHLADLSSVREGALINVPKVEGLRLAPEASQGGELRTALRVQLAGGLDAARTRLRDSVKREDTDLTNAIKAEASEATKEALTKRQKEVQAFGKAQLSALEELSSDLEELIKRVL